MPRRKKTAAAEESTETRGASVRPFWSGTITFGLVAIPVDLLSAVRVRQTGLRMVDKDGHALGRQYHCSKEGKKLDNDDLVRGIKTADGKIIEITDEELESVAPEMSGDIDLKNFVPLAQIPPMFFQKPYYLVPSGKSSKAYHLLAATMERTGRVGIGSFVMRGHEYLVAIVSDNGVLRADTLRYADEIRTPETIGLPKPKAAAKKVEHFLKAIDHLKRDKLDISEFADKEAAALKELVAAKQQDKENVVHPSGMESDDEDAPEGGRGAQIIDFMDVLRKSLSKNAVVRNAENNAPISLAERREQRGLAHASKTAKKSTTKRKSTRKRSRRS